MAFGGFVITIPRLHVEGMALFPFILVKKRNAGKALLNHEQIHLRQQLELGILLFYLLYLLEYSVRLSLYRNHDKAYFNISFEREAYRNQGNPEYLNQRPWYAFTRYLFTNKI